MSELSVEPEMFRRAVTSLGGVRPRPEVQLGPIRPPQQLAPWTYALGAQVVVEACELATARLVLLHDPDGQEAWDGTLRLVAYVRAELETELAGDPLLPEVGWSWLTDALHAAGVEHRALGGTVTRTSSARFGEIAGPERTDDVELRASWTPVGPELGAHGQAFCDLVAAAAGLPPVGVATLVQRDG